MTAFIIVLGLLAVGAAVLFWMRKRQQDEVRSNSLSAEALYSLVTANQELLIFDVRQPLDLLAYPEIIPGARRIPPDDILEDCAALIPRDKNTVVYCTCPGDKTSRAVMQKARAARFSQVKFLAGGLAAWKAKGYPVEPYREVFHLYKAASSRAATVTK